MAAMLYVLVVALLFFAAEKLISAFVPDSVMDRVVRILFPGSDYEIDVEKENPPRRGGTNGGNCEKTHCL